MDTTCLAHTGVESRHGISSVLVVDDDDGIREELVELIENAGYTATGVSNGREALDYLATTVPPKLMFLDLMMPVVDGWEVLTEMRRVATLATIAVVVISARYSEFADVSAPALSVRRMTKPLDADALYKVLDDTCGHAR